MFLSGNFLAILLLLNNKIINFLMSFNQDFEYKYFVFDQMFNIIINLLFFAFNCNGIFDEIFNYVC